MNYSTIISNAHAEAQTVLAQLGGMVETDSANFQYAGNQGIGVFGAPEMVEIPEVGGGYRRRVQLRLTVTRDQSFAFEAKTRLVRLATATQPAITYTIDFIDGHDPFTWGLVLVKTG